MTSETDKVWTGQLKRMVTEARKMKTKMDGFLYFKGGGALEYLHACTIYKKIII